MCRDRTTFEIPQKTKRRNEVEELMSLREEQRTFGLTYFSVTAGVVLRGPDSLRFMKMMWKITYDETDQTSGRSGARSRRWSSWGWWRNSWQRWGQVICCGEHWRKQLKEEDDEDVTKTMCEEKTWSRMRKLHNVRNQLNQDEPITNSCLGHSLKG